MIYYHKTDVQNIRSILTEGLLTKYGHYKGRVYLCRYPDMDMGLGKALFAIDIPDDDPDLYDNGEGWQIVSFKDIPSGWVTYLGEYGPNEKPDLKEDEE